MTPAELAAVQAHLRRLLGNEQIKLSTPNRKGGGDHGKTGDWD